MPGSGIQDLATTMILRPLLRGVAATLFLAAGAASMHSFVAGGVHASPLALAAVAVLGAAAAILFLRRDLALPRLRVLELAVIGAVAAYFAAANYARIASAAAAGDPVLSFSHWQTAVTHCVLLAVAYGIFVPNRWLRAATVVLPLIAMPFALGFILRIRHPHVADALSWFPASEKMASTALELIIGATVAILGAHLTSSYQVGYVRASVLGMYDLIEKIGSGGMGEVWLARHHVLARPAAIKLIRQDLLGNPNLAGNRLALQRFAREARAAAALRSPHTIEIYDFGISQTGVFFYVMEYLHGLDLDTLVQRFGPVPVERTIHFLLQACDSLTEAHDHHMVHRDIKPGNIHACRMGILYDYVKILDFGLVKPGKEQFSDPTVSAEETATGTPAYMAPEVITKAHAIDLRSDLYSLGCVGYWLVTGRPLFESGTALAVMAEHVKTEPDPPSQRTEIPIPAELDRILLRCVAKDPSARFQSARELSAALATVPVSEPWTNARAEQWWKLHAPDG